MGIDFERLRRNSINEKAAAELGFLGGGIRDPLERADRCGVWIRWRCPWTRILAPRYSVVRVVVVSSLCSFYELILQQKHKK
jgi:hypothetical protein